MDNILKTVLNKKLIFTTQIEIKMDNKIFSSRKVIIDTGCSRSVIALKAFEINNLLIDLMRQKDLNNKSIQKVLSFGVNDSTEEADEIQRKFNAGKYRQIRNQLSTIKRLEYIKIGNAALNDIDIKINYTRDSPILIGMDISSKFDIHIGPDKTNNNIITLLACPLDKLKDEYYKGLEETFGLGDKILTSEINDY